MTEARWLWVVGLGCRTGAASAGAGTAARRGRHGTCARRGRHGLVRIVVVPGD